jgi:hypothetical protein
MVRLICERSIVKVGTESDHPCPNKEREIMTTTGCYTCKYSVDFGPDIGSEICMTKCRRQSHYESKFGDPEAERLKRKGRQLQEGLTCAACHVVFDSNNLRCQICREGHEWREEQKANAQEVHPSDMGFNATVTDMPQPVTHRQCDCTREDHLRIHCLAYRDGKCEADSPCNPDDCEDCGKVNADPPEHPYMELKRDLTNHPDHYTNRKMECWDWYEEAMTPEEFVGAMKNNVWKYTYRCGSKDDSIQDLTKAVRYLERWIRFIEENN